MTNPQTAAQKTEGSFPFFNFLKYKNNNNKETQILAKRDLSQLKPLDLADLKEKAQIIERDLIQQKSKYKFKHAISKFIKDKKHTPFLSTLAIFQASTIACTISSSSFPTFSFVALSSACVGLVMLSTAWELSLTTPDGVSERVKGLILQYLHALPDRALLEIEAILCKSKITCTNYSKDTQQILLILSECVHYKNNIVMTSKRKQKSINSIKICLQMWGPRAESEEGNTLADESSVNSNSQAMVVKAQEQVDSCVSNHGYYTKDSLAALNKAYTNNLATSSHVHQLHRAKNKLYRYK